MCGFESALSAEMREMHQINGSMVTSDQQEFAHGDAQTIQGGGGQGQDANKGATHAGLGIVSGMMSPRLSISSSLPPTPPSAQSLELATSSHTQGQQGSRQGGGVRTESVRPQVVVMGGASALPPGTRVSKLQEMYEKAASQSSHAGTPSSSWHHRTPAPAAATPRSNRSLYSSQGRGTASSVDNLAQQRGAWRLERRKVRDQMQIDMQKRRQRLAESRAESRLRGPQQTQETLLISVLADRSRTSPQASLGKMTLPSSRASQVDGSAAGAQRRRRLVSLVDVARA
jgi:hypothetical protein